MITLGVLFLIIGTLPYVPANTASINYEPIKITVNENFNVQPGRVSQGQPSVNPNFAHQGANFYFNPKLFLPPDYIPPHIKALISFIKQKNESFSKEKKNISETIKPLGDLESEFSKDTLSGIVVEKENVIEVLKPLPALPITIEKEDVSEDIEITEVSMPTPTEVIVMEKIEKLPPTPSIIIDENPKTVNQEILVGPEAPVSPPISYGIIPTDVVEEIKIEEPILLEEPVELFPPISEISSGPILEPIRVPEITIVEENLDISPSPLPVIIDEEPKPVNQKLVAIPEAPVLPPLSLNVISPNVVEEVKIEEPISLEESEEVFPPISEISTGPILEPIRVPEITIVEENLDISTSPLPVIIDEEPKPVNQELVAIAEAPVLPPLSLNVISPNVVEEVKIEEPILLEEPVEVFPPISEISSGPILEPIRVPEITIVEENLDKPPSPPPLTINEELKPATVELIAIPEAPVLPPLSLDVIPPNVAEEVKIEEPISLEESVEVFPPIAEISTGPTLEPIRVPEITIVEENLDMPPSPPPVIIDEEPKPGHQELIAIPEAPVLPPLSLDVIPPNFVEEVKIEEPMLLEEPVEVFPPISEISTGPILEPIRVPEITIVEENLDMPPLPPPIIIDEEPKFVNQELVAIPEAPVLPPLSLDVIPPNFVEEVKIEEPMLLEEPVEVFPPISEISTGPILEPIRVPEITIVEENLDMPPLPPPIIIDEEPKFVNQELVAIPEAPVLPPLSLDVIPPNVVEEVKIEEPISLEESVEVFPPIMEISTGLTLEPIRVPEITIVEENLDMPPSPPPVIIDEEPKPGYQELKAIPEAPVLPPLTLDVIPPNVVEEVKIEEPMLLEEPVEVFPPISEISSGPILEPIRVPEITIVEENLDMPPLPPPIIIDEEPKFVNQELVAFPEAPVLPTQSFDIIPSNVVEEGKIEEPILWEKSVELFPSISEMSTRPILEPIIVPEIPDSFENSIPIPCAKCVFSNKENVSPIIIPEQKKTMRTYYTYLPMNNRKDFVNSKFKENLFLRRINKQPFRFPLVPLNKLLSKFIMTPKPVKKNQFLFSTSCAHNIVEERINPNVILKRKFPNIINIRSAIPKRPSKIKYLGF